LVQKRVCKISGKLAGQDCPKDEVIVDWFDPRSVPEEVCDRHGTFQVCADSGKLPGPYCPEESISTKAVYFLEAESPYWQLSRDQISKWIPRAYFGFNSLWEINSLDYENPEHANHFCHIHTAPPLPDPGDVWDDSLDKLKEFFEGLMPGNNEEKPRNEESNNGDIEGEDGNNGDNHYDDFDDEHVTDVSD
ncbi:MAG: hypothetical protein ACOX77_10255, partial [Caldicoprobacterales bacterium]